MTIANRMMIAFRITSPSAAVSGKVFIVMFLDVVCHAVARDNIVRWLFTFVV